MGSARIHSAAIVGLDAVPIEVEADKVAASLKNGVLTIRLPKAKRAKSISVKIKED